MHGFGSVKELAAIRKARPRVNVPVYGPKLPKHGAIYYAKAVNKYCIPFMGESVDFCLSL